MKSARLVAVLLMSVSGVATASTLTVSVGGQFSSGVTNSQLSAPNGSFSMSFNLPNTPAAGNVDMFGFDSYFVGFSYELNGTLVPVVPQSIRFSTASNFGLFTVFFGPESGYDSNGNPIPEFSFEGPQAFSGSTSSPTILPGSYAVSYWIYSDDLNYDQHAAAGNYADIKTAVPEPSSLGLLLPIIGVLCLASMRRRWS